MGVCDDGSDCIKCSIDGGDAIYTYSKHRGGKGKYDLPWIEVCENMYEDP